MSADLLELDDDTGHGRGQRGTSGKGRVRQTTLVLLVSVLALPTLALVMRFLIALDPSKIGLAVWVVLVLMGVLLPGVALFYGYRVTKRIPGVIWHVFATLEVFALWLSLTMALSWDNITGPWYWRLADVAVLPVWWWMLHIPGSLAVGGSWLVAQTNALRAASGGGKGDGGWAELFGTKGVKPRMAEVVVTDAAIEVPLDHPGVPLGNFRSQAIAKINDKPGVFAGGTTIVRDGEMGGRSVLRIPTGNPFDPSRWAWWPGPSQPGETYEAPIHTAVYENGDPQWFAFAKTPDGVSFAACPEFRSPGASFLGRQGMTGAGKSGDACIEEAEVLSRRDVVLVHVAPAKLRQNAGWLLDMATLAAEGDRISLLFRALRKLGDFRDTVDLGRDFSSAVAAATGRPWIHIFADEFDIAKQGTDLEWLLTKGRSLGFRFSFTLPRATSKNMSTDIRGAIGAWKQFGISQDYDSAFVISDETMAAIGEGGGPQTWAATIPGAHILDGAPGVKSSKYPMPARTYKTREDYADLRSKTLAARAQFVPATFPQDELDVLGEVMEICNPLRYLSGAGDPIRVDAQVSDPDLQKTLNLSDLDDEDLEGPMVTGDDVLDELLASFSRLEMPDGVDPRQPLVAADDTVGETLISPPGKPQPPSKEAAIEEFDAALTRLAEQGKTEVQNQQIADEMRYLFRPDQTSKHLKKLLSGEEVIHNPAPGVLMQRVPGRAGRYTLTRL